MLHACLQAPAGVIPQDPGEMPYAAPFIPPASLPPPESADPELLDSWQPGRRRAVLIGCNYSAIPQAALKGCVNDANLLRQLMMEHFGYCLAIPA